MFNSGLALMKQLNKWKHFASVWWVAPFMSECNRIMTSCVSQWQPKHLFNNQPDTEMAPTKHTHKHTLICARTHAHTSARLLCEKSENTPLAKGTFCSCGGFTNRLVFFKLETMTHSRLQQYLPPLSHFYHTHPPADPPTHPCNSSHRTVTDGGRYWKFRLGGGASILRGFVVWSVFKEEANKHLWVPHRRKDSVDATQSCSSNIMRRAELFHQLSYVKVPFGHGIGNPD